MAQKLKPLLIVSACETTELANQRFDGVTSQDSGRTSVHCWFKRRGFMTVTGCITPILSIAAVSFTFLGRECQPINSRSHAADRAKPYAQSARTGVGEKMGGTNAGCSAFIGYLNLRAGFVRRSRCVGCRRG